MLLTIHAFVKRGECCKQVPLVFVLITGKKTADYVAVFESVRQMIPNCKLKGFVIDYEKALWRATRIVFEDINIRGCAFHWGQAIWRHIENFGLATQYHKGEQKHS